MTTEKHSFNIYGYGNFSDRVDMEINIMITGNLDEDVRVYYSVTRKQHGQEDATIKAESYFYALRAYTEHLRQLITDKIELPNDA